LKDAFAEGYVRQVMQAQLNMSTPPQLSRKKQKIAFGRTHILNKHFWSQSFKKVNSVHS
jgi:hypothetical protein